jgi:hypothetical protein
MPDQVADFLRNSPRITHETLGYLAATLDAPQETDEEVPLQTALLICNCPSYAFQHRH